MRSLSREARHERRVQVIRLRKAGHTYEQIEQQTGLSRTGVFNICTRHAGGGAAALKDAVGGRKLGEKRLLTAPQESAMRKFIQDKTPDQLKLPYALWTRATVAQLIEERIGVKLIVDLVSQSTRHRDYRAGLTAAAPVLATSSSWEPVPPEQPIAPMICPASMSGMPPRDAMMSSRVNR